MRKPQNSNDLNSKFERVVRELRAKFRGGELRARLRWESGARRGFGASSELLAALSGRIVWPQLGRTLMKGVGRDQGFRAPELCAAGATGIE